MKDEVKAVQALFSSFFLLPSSFFLHRSAFILPNRPHPSSF
jgi:hypothetical protein